MGNLLWRTDLIVRIQEAFSSSWYWVFELFSYLGDTQGVLLLAALTFWISGRRLTYSLVGIVVFSMTIDLVIGTLIGLPRPEDPQIIVWKDEFTSSFPSGHTALATSMWGMLATLNWMPKVITAIAVAGVMLSRLYFGVHYLGDVIGGVLIGAVLTVAYLRALPTLDAFFAARSFKFFQFAGGLIFVAVLVAIPFAGDSARVWHVMGTVAGFIVGGLIEYRYIRFSPAPISRTGQAFKLLIGLGVLILLLLVPLLLDDQLVLEALLFFVAALWTLLFAPILFAWMRLSATPLTSRRVR
ncbi:phosphatase PAP2 family protein [Gloeocapsopsis sp. IPPAS B-1203]|uniref:phosphatase PAP2 family protein n=1 Tax=Gloeocapsopsis sp. IPPAS B-1203 TaxID=2049454 RepID=UPI0025A025DE|nr:phosphatase PAP2 family protein [Gloeocapsopsis sp. IPPAS B-1203]